MKVDQTRRNSLPGVKPSSGSRGVKSSNFDSLLISEQKIDPVASTNRISSVDAVVGMQEITDDNKDERGAKNRANLILDKLEDIRMGLLLGEIPKSNLEELSKVLRVARENSVDSKLLEIIDDIELRAKIELAKLEIIN
ncbi:MAG: flagellar assembly protein FliX [Thalassobaculaceae bacterium]|tara:strand:+ start:940 stop:1356 length:417 start_codon:yes stop_codon:yes gene_type:complete